MSKLRPIRPLVTLLAVATAMAPIAAAQAQDKYPSKFVRIITTTGTGTGPDVVMRLIAEQLSRDWGHQVVVENNSTGGGLVAAQQAQQATPDGYTLLSASASSFTVLPIRQERAPTQLGTHLKPIAFLGELPMLIAVSPKLGVKTLKELIDLSNKEPNRVLYVANASGTLPHMTGVYLASKAGANFTFVPHRGAAEGLNSLMSGAVNMAIDNYAAFEGQIQAGQLIPIALASTSRVPNLPSIPNIAETIPGFVAIGWAALTAPAGVPDAIVEKVNADVRRIFAKPDVAKRMIELGNYPKDMTTAEVAAFIKQEQAQWHPIVKSLIQQPAGDKK